MNKKPLTVTVLKVFIILLIAAWGVVGSYRVITSEIMNYSIFNQKGSISLLESTEHDGALFVGRGKGGGGRGGGSGGGGHDFSAAPDAFSRYINYAGMFALIILIVYWTRKYTDFRKETKKQIISADRL